MIPFANVLVRFLLPGPSSASSMEQLKLDSFDDIPMNSAKVVRFGKEPVIVVHTETGQFKAFFARCTHLGCVVKYDAEGTSQFLCNCHGSTFDLTGKNLTGPAPRPLTPLRVTVEKTSLVLSRRNV
jgi:cytochrome b6-f complex iron-sulfur subunit